MGQNQVRAVSLLYTLTFSGRGKTAGGSVLTGLSAWASNEGNEGKAVCFLKMEYLQFLSF